MATRQLSALETKILGYLIRGAKSTGQLRAYLEREDIDELEQTLLRMREEGLIACVNGRWFQRGAAPRWGST